MLVIFLQRAWNLGDSFQLINKELPILSLIFLLDPVDISILLGSSQPNANGKFKAQIAFVKKLIGKFDISKQAILPAFVSYGPIPTAVSRIGEITNKLMAERTIDRIRNSNDSSDLSSALSLVKNYVFSTEQGARPNVARSILVFVDKKNEGDPKVINELGKKFKDDRTKLVIIVLGDEVDKETLKPMTHKNGVIFFPPTLEDLEKSIEPVSLALQPGKQRALIDLISH